MTIYLILLIPASLIAAVGKFNYPPSAINEMPQFTAQKLKIVPLCSPAPLMFSSTPFGLRQPKFTNSSCRRVPLEVKFILPKRRKKGMIIRSHISFLDLKLKQIIRGNVEDGKCQIENWCFKKKSGSLHQIFPNGSKVYHFTCG